jgi:hypothetical protein
MFACLILYAEALPFPGSDFNGLRSSAASRTTYYLLIAFLPLLSGIRLPYGGIGKTA